MQSSVRRVLFSAAARGLRPPDALPISTWAEENILFGELSPEPGPFRVRRTPYMGRVLEVMSPDHPCESAAMMAGTQLGKTTMQLIIAAYFLAQVPSSVMVTLPDKLLAKEWSDKRLSDLFASSPLIEGRLTDPNDHRGRGENNTFSKIVPGGGMLKVAWATSSSQVRSTPVKVSLTDEVDQFKADLDHQGDVIRLIDRRQTNYYGAKAFHASSPKLKIGSIINREFVAGDQERYFLPCPNCRHHQVLLFERFVWPEGEPEKICLKCQACQELISEAYKTDMLEQGLWVATADHPGLVQKGFAIEDMELIAPILEGMQHARHVTMWLNSYYSPAGWYSWARAATEWERDKGDPVSRKVYINTVMAEPYEERGSAPEEEHLYGKREFYQRGVVPVGGLFLTAFVDVQKSPGRLECEIVAWGRDKEQWSVDYHTEMGDPEDTAVWDALERKILMKDWPTAYPSGVTMPIMVMGVDSGDQADRVYEFARRHPQPGRGAAGHFVCAPRTVVCTKGNPSFDRLIANISTDDAARKRGNIAVYHIGTGYAKQQIYHRLKLPMPEEEGKRYPAGYRHHPDYPFSYFRGLSSEELRTSSTGQRMFVKDPAKPRNEPLDCAVGNLFAAGLFGADNFGPDHWAHLEALVGYSTESESDGEAVPVAPFEPVAMPRSLAQRRPPGRRIVARFS